MRSVASVARRSAIPAEGQERATKAAGHDREPQPVPRLDWSFRNVGVEGALPPVSISTLSQTAFQRKLVVNEPGDQYEQEADRVAEQVMRMPEPCVSQAKSSLDAAPVVQRKCAQCEKEEKLQRKCAMCEEEEKLQRKESQGASAESAFAPPIVNDVLRSPGQPLDSATRAFFEPRFNYDFSRVRIHSDGRAAKSARSVGAMAYTVAPHIAFGENHYEPGSDTGKRLLAHELTHIVQNSPGKLRRSAVTEEGPATEDLTQGEQPDAPVVASAVPASPVSAAPRSPRTATVPAPESCPPPKMGCTPDTSPVGAVSNEFIFPQDSALLDASEKRIIDGVAASWRTAGGTGTVRVDGFASSEGECTYNWNLSCRRAQAVASELKSPTDKTAGIPATNIEIFAHGENNEAGPTLAVNRRATIKLPAPPPPQPQPAKPCPMPVLLGNDTSDCGSGADFLHFDRPSISLKSEAKLAAWAYTAHGKFTRWLVPDFECALEMDGVLIGLAGADGHTAFSRFVAGTGGTLVWGPTTTLSLLALASPEFAVTLAKVKRSIESQLAMQASSGSLDPCTLSVTPPRTHFASAHFYYPGPLKAIIGGTHGVKLWATAFLGDPKLRTYSIALRFELCDNFGVDESDLYAPGLFPFWVLQHERSSSLYAPFINELDLPTIVSGTF
ncbi:MAG TPA: DUF4157 domain-containing protein [Candidatus Angelobacter sp.]|jgi:outer membrane protein OmpA-like peptidoglycan-associated protein